MGTTTWHDPNSFGYSSKKAVEKEPQAVEVEVVRAVPVAASGPDVRLSEAKFVEGSDGFQFNKKCYAQVKVEYLTDTSRKKVTFDLSVTTDGQEESLGHSVEGFEKDGIARAEVTLFYGDKYHEKLGKDPAKKCSYTFKASHPKGEKTITSEPLEMPSAGSTGELSIDIEGLPETKPGDVLVLKAEKGGAEWKVQLDQFDSSGAGTHKATFKKIPKGEANYSLLVTTSTGKVLEKVLESTPITIR